VSEALLLLPGQWTQRFVGGTFLEEHLIIVTTRGRSETST
jgi:hypothetical protein